MGYAIAEAAADRGHLVTLVSGPVSLAPFERGTVIPVESAAEMFEAVASRIAEADVAVFCAAVADYTLAEPAREKIKKTGDSLTLELVPTRDILGSARSLFGFAGLLVGFAAETENLAEHAARKLERKGCDLLVANDVSRPGTGFDSTENEVTLFYRERDPLPLPRASKKEIAVRIIQEIESLLQLRTP